MTIGVEIFWIGFSFVGVLFLITFSIHNYFFYFISVKGVDFAALLELKKKNNSDANQLIRNQLLNIKDPLERTRILKIYSRLLILYKTIKYIRNVYISGIILFLAYAFYNTFFN